ncbi:MAG: glutamyl-tRNA reductase [Propionibacteriaceae bacterium]|nr:glutamyl-tRNA reductase [Propionibacteriaceae bacterium]
MPITAVGISHHLVALEELAELSRVADQATTALDADPRLLGRVVLSTCNRFEVYFESDSFHSSLEAVLATISAALPPASRDIVDQFEIYPGQAAVQHLLEVASGLDSMVIGEAEIIGQVREALAGAGSLAGPSLTRLFHAALTTAKAISSSTGLGAAGRSIATVGLELVERRHFALAGRSVLLVGTGSYARVVTAALNRLGCTDLSIYSPSGRAERFAATHPVQPVPPAGLAAAIGATDLLVTCSGGPVEAGPVIGARLLAESRAATPSLVPVLDLSLTGDVDPEAATLLGIDLIDLEEIGAHAPAEQAAAVLAARDLVTRGVDTYLHLEQGRAATPAVTAMRAHVSQFIEREIEAASRRHDPATAAAVARSLRRVSNALLHTPSLRAAELARSGELADYSHALQTLFGIEVQAEA